MRGNVRIDKALQHRIDDNSLSAADYLRLSVADEMARLFPKAKVYTAPQHQGITPPAAFVHIFDIVALPMLGGVTALDMAVDISYIPSEETAYDERLHAAMSVMLDLERNIPCGIGVFKLTGFNYKVTEDGIAKVTCSSRVEIERINNDVVMADLEQGVDVNE